MSRSTAVLLGLAITITACGKNEEPVVTSTPTQTPAAQGPNLDSLRADSLAKAAEAAAAAAAAAAQEAERLRAALVNQVAATIHFDYDAFAIRSGDESNMRTKADIMRANPALRIRVVGHADERGSDEYNLALGMRRAVAAKDYLVRLGIDAGRIDVASLGEEVPLDPSSNESAWQQNRRDEFEITAGATTLVSPR